MMSRKDETEEQRRVRLLLEDDRAEHTVPPMVLQRGIYADVTVVAEDRSQATVKRNRRTDPIADLYHRGTVTEEQYEAAVQIARVAEMLARPVAVRSASLEARVDNSGSAKDMLIEQVDRVRLEATYSAWRAQLPMPKRLVLDMVIDGRPIFATARRYRIGFPKARKQLIDALDRWNSLRGKLVKEIDEQDVLAAHYRAGGGIIA